MQLKDVGDWCHMCVCVCSSVGPGIAEGAELQLSTLFYFFSWEGEKGGRRSYWERAERLASATARGVRVWMGTGKREWCNERVWN